VVRFEQLFFMTLRSALSLGPDFCDLLHGIFMIIGMVPDQIMLENMDTAASHSPTELLASGSNLTYPMKSPCSSAKPTTPSQHQQTPST